MAYDTTSATVFPPQAIQPSFTPAHVNLTTQMMTVRVINLTPGAPRYLKCKKPFR